MSFTSRFRNYFQNWLGKNKKDQPIRKRTSKAPLLVELLEDRTLLSTLPAAVTQPVATSLGAGLSPTVAVDPLDPMRIVEVQDVEGSQTTTTAAGKPGSVTGNYSTDEGRTWTAFTVTTALLDPGISAGNDDQFIQITDSDVAFDRNHHFYVVSSEHNGNYTSGAIVMQRFNFTGNAPVQDMSLNSDIGVGGTGTAGNTVIYRWYGTDNNGNAIDPAAHPVVGIDDNDPSFTDPVTGATQTDSMATMVAIPATASYPADLVPKAIYVAYNVDQSYPIPGATQYQSRVFVVGSADGGRTFTDQELVSAPDPNENPTVTQAANPQFIFTQGTATQPGGQVYVFFNDYNAVNANNQAIADPNDIYYSVSQPDGGVASTPVTATKIFSNDTTIPIADAQPNPGTGTGNTGGDIPSTTNDGIAVDFSANPDINTTNFESIFESVTDLTVTVNLVDPNIDELSLVLMPPNGLAPVTLLLNRTDGMGATLPPAPTIPAPQGLPAATSNSGLGVIQVSTTNRKIMNPVGTVFDDSAPRNINEPTSTGGTAYTVTAVAPYVGHFKPEVGSLRAILADPDFLAKATGIWTLELTDFKSEGTATPPTQMILNWSLHFTGLIATTQGATPLAATPPNPNQNTTGGSSGFGVNTAIDIPGIGFYPQIGPDLLNNGAGAGLDTYPINTTVAPAGTPGIGPNFSVAIDNTLGSFSPFQGRIYLVYTGQPTKSTLDTNIQLLSLDTAGALAGLWTSQPALGQVNDDAPGDNFSEGNRQKFNPTVAVDPVTGTVGVMWYDGRYDAQHVRVANAFTTSIDGGVDFAPDVFLNTEHTAQDFYTGATVFLEPTPDNMTTAGALGFGDRSGLAMYGGRVYDFWSGNLDAGGATVFSNYVTVAGGPRIDSGDMGPIVTDTVTGSSVYNNTFAPDGTRQLTGFVLTFDRPVDPGTFTPNLVDITYRNPTTPAGSPGTDISNQITGITPIDISASHGPNDPGTPPEFSISDTIVQEPSTGQSFAVFTVVLSQAVSTTSAVDWATQNGTGNAAAASSGPDQDYIPSSGTLLFNANQTTASFQVPIKADALFTSNRYFLVNLSNSGGILIDRAQGKGTIISNINLPALTVGNAYGLKGTGTGNTTLNFPVFLNQPAPANVSVDYSFSNGTASNGTDYLGNSGIATLTIPQGTTTGTISVTVRSNQINTGNLNFFLNLTNPVNASITRSQAVGVIVDDNSLAASVGDLTVQQPTSGPQTAYVTFYLNGATSNPVTINYATANGSARSGTDFTAVTNGSVTIPVGSQSVTAPITILPSPSLAIAKISETGSTVTVTTTATNPFVTGDSVTIAGVSVAGYNSSNGNTFPITVTSPTTFTYTASTTGLATVTGGGTATRYDTTNRSFQVRITGVTNAAPPASGSVGSFSTVTIVDDDLTPTIVLGDAIGRQASTGTVTYDMPVFLSYPNSAPITINYQTVAGGPNATSAKAGTDYVAIPATNLTIPAAASATIASIKVTGTATTGNAAVPENTVTVVTTAPNGFVNNDPVMIQGGVDGSGNAVTAYNGTYQITVVNPTTFTYTMTKTTPTLPNVTGGSATVSGGVIHLQYMGNLNPTTQATLNPTFAVQINNVAPGSNAIIGRQLGIATIVSDTVELSVGDVTVRETATGTVASFPVYISGPTEQAISATLTTADGPSAAAGGTGAAVAGTDYTATTKTVTFQPGGPLVQIITVPILHNPAANDVPTSFTLTASNMTVGGQGAPAGLIAKPVGTGTIVDSDDQTNGPFFSFGNFSAFEANNVPTTINVPVFVNMSSTTAITVTVNTTGGAALITPLVNFTATLNAGATTFNIPITLNPNTTPFGNVPVTITLSAPSGGSLTNNAMTESATFTLIDDNSDTINIGSAFGYVSQNLTPPTTLNFPVVVANEPPPLAPPPIVPPPATITGTYSTADGTATTANNDYAAQFATPFNNNNAAGNAVDKVILPVFVDGSTTAQGPPGYQTFTTTIANATNAFINPAQGTATGYIINGNVLNLSVGDASVMDTANGANMVFTVYLNGTSGAPVNFSWNLKEGTAKANLDYAGPQSGTASIAAGSTFTTISVPIVPEVFYKGNRAFSLAISKPIGGGIQRASGTGTIMDSQLTPTLTLSDAIVQKGIQPIATFTETGNVVTVTTPAPHNFHTNQKVTIAGAVDSLGHPVAGYNGAFVITVTSPTTFTYTAPVTGLVPASAGTATSNQETFTVFANYADAASAAISSLTEGASGTTVTVTTAAPNLFTTGDSVTIAGSSVAGYNGNFSVNVTSPTTFTYTASSAGLATVSGTTALTLSEPSGTTVTATTAAANQFASNEVVTIAGAVDALGNPVPGYNGTFTITVVNPTTFTFTSFSTGLAGATGNAVTSASGALATTMTITPSDLTAVASKGDYVSAPFTVTLPAGAVSTTFNITTNSSNTPEGDVLFRATLSNPANGDLISPRIADQDQGAVGEGIATIVDSNSVPAINIGDLEVVEGYNGQKTVNIPVILTTVSTVPITVQVNTSDGTLLSASDGPALANTNYVPINSLTVTIPAFTKIFNIPVTILGNSDYTGVSDLNFSVSLVNAVGATINKDKATVTIANPNSLLGATQFLVSVNPQSGVGTYSYSVQPLVADRIRVPFFQGAPSLTISNQTVQNNANSVTFNLTLSQASLQTITVLVNTQNGTAVGNTDFVPIINQLVTFLAGSTQATVTVSLLGAGSNKPFRTFSLTASDMTVGESLAPSSVILDDTAVLSGPSVPTVATLTESGSTATVTTTSTHSFTSNDLVTIAGASVPAYDGTFVITVTSPTTFTYTLPNTGLAAATGGSAALQINNGTASIVNQNDSSNTFWSVDDVTAADGTTQSGPTGVTNFTFHIFTNKSFATNQTVLVSTSGSSSDYVPLVKFPVTLPAGSTSTTVTVQVQNNLNLTANAVFNVILSAPSAGVLGQKPVGTGIIIANQNAANPFDPTQLSVNPLTWQTVVPVSITQGNTAPDQQNVPIFVAALNTGQPYVATSTININNIDPAQVLRDLTVTINAAFPDTSSLLVQLAAPSGGTVQTLTVDATGGTYTLTFEGATTVPIANNASAAVVQSDLQALATIGTNGVTVTGSGGIYTITFNGFTNPPTLVTDASLLIGRTQSAVALPTPTFTLSSGAAGANFPNTVFDDQAFTSITARNTSSVQTITVDATGGTFTISFEGETTSAIPFNASATVVQNQLQALLAIGSGNITVTQSGKVYTLSFNQDVTNFPNLMNPPTVTTNASKLTGKTHTAIAAPILPQTLPNSFRTVTPFGGGATAFTIATLTPLGGGFVLATTAAANPFVTNDQVTIAGASVAAYDGTFPVLAVLDATDFEYFDPTLPLGAVTATAGTATPVGSTGLAPGSPLNGVWTLIITNTSTANFGTLLDWSLRLQTGFLSSNYTPADPGFYGSLGNAMNQTQTGFTASLTRDPTDIFAMPTPVNGVPLAITAPFLSPPYDPTTLPLIIPGPHGDTIKYSTADEVDTLNFGTSITGGTFTLTFDGVSTGPIPWNVDPTVLQSNIQTALFGLAPIGQGNVIVSDSPTPTVTFVNALAGLNPDNSNPATEVGNVPALSFNGSALQGGTLNSITGSVIGAPLVNVVQTINFSSGVTGGTFTLTFNGKTTAPIAWSANIATLQGNIMSALLALPTIALPTFSNTANGYNVIVGSAANPTVSFVNALSGANIPLMTFNAVGLTGGTITSISSQVLDLATATAIANLSEVGTSVTVTTAGANQFATNESVTISGASVPAYDGTFVVVVNSPTSFTYNLTTTGLLPGTGGTAQIAGQTDPAVPLDFPIPIAVNDPHTNIATPGVLNVPLVVANAPANQVITGLTVRIGIQHPDAADLRISLVAPDGTTILLSDENGLGGANYDGTTFDDNAAASIVGGIAPFQGTFAPQEVGGLTSLNGKSLNGTWNLKVEDMVADGLHGQVLYWQIIPTTGLILNQTNSFVDVVFDRQINPNTINATNVINMLGPVGQITGPFTVTANPTVPGSAVPVYPPEYAGRVFRISFPTQQMSGSYSLVLGPVTNKNTPSLNKTIQDLAGNAIDTNLNAGLYVLEDADPTTTTITTNPPYTPATVNQIFVPGASAISTIVIPNDYIITQSDVQHIELSMSISDANTPDLVGTLTAPDGTIITLFTNVGRYGALAGNQHPDPGNITTFDDFATFAIQNAAVGLGGMYKPQEPLSNLVGKNAKGTWTLTITNQTKNSTNAYSIGTFTGTLLNWSLTFPSTVPGSGLGETGADQLNVGFRIFTESPTNSLSSSTWTAIGPAPENGGTGTGPVSAVAVDPADPTGNTVYAAGTKGGIWKTYNFLTTNPSGPNWIPLTDLGPLNGLNINTLTAIASPDGDPNKTLVLAGTGTAVAATGTDERLAITNSGVGFLRSPDGGRTWQVIDSLQNNVVVNQLTGVQTATPIANPTPRDHVFDGTAINQIVIDPHPIQNNPSVPILALVETGTSVTVTTSTAVSFATNSMVIIQGVPVIGYNGTFGVTVTSPTTFTYTVASAGLTASRGGTATLTGTFIVYAAVTGSRANNSGLFQSLDSGLTWTLVEGGNCTSVVIAGGSSGNSGTGPAQDLYAGFVTSAAPLQVRTGGVYFTSSATSLSSAAANSMLPVPNNGAGAPGANQGVNSRLNDDNFTNVRPNAPYPVISVGPSNTPSGTTSPIILATPAQQNKPLQDALYPGWIYAYTAGQLYESKDFGANWTNVQLPMVVIGGVQYPTDDTTVNAAAKRSDFSFTAIKSILVDPSNPNVIYVAGTSTLGGLAGFNLLGESVIRVDLTKVSDVYSFVSYDYSAAADPNPAITSAQNFAVGDVNNIELNLLDPVTGIPLPYEKPNSNPSAGAAGPAEVENVFSLTFPTFTNINDYNYLSMLRDPLNPFLAPSSLQFEQGINFRNDGSDVSWQFLDFGQSSVNQMTEITDPVTGNVRLIAADLVGIATMVNEGAGFIDTGIGLDTVVNGDRTGNLQVSEITQTGAQPSTLAADIAGALLFSENPVIGVAMSDPNIFQDGNITWGNLSPGWGEMVNTDPTGSGTVFRYQYPSLTDFPANNGTTFVNGNDFFEINTPGTIPTTLDPNASGVSAATSGLIQAGDFPGTTGAGQWPNGAQGSNFAVNPIGIPGDFEGMVMSSYGAGRIFRVSGASLSAGLAGIVWQDIGDPNVLDGSYAPAVAFGSPALGVTNVDNFIYAGTLDGNIFVTFTGGGTSWTNISNGLDGSPVLSISPDPVRGTFDAFAVTQTAVYYCANTRATAPVWTRISDTPGKGYIFPNAAAGQSGVLRPVWNNTSDMAPAFNAATGLTSMAVDWRFAIPNATGGGTHPVLYIGGDGGVVTSSDMGATWTIFPSLANDATATQIGGYLPSVRVTGLQLILGNINQVTGIPDTSSGLNMLVASTYGRGDFAIRINSSAYSQFLAIPNSGPQVASIAPLTGTFGELLTGITVTFKGTVDPTTFTPGSVSFVKGPTGAIIPVRSVLDVTGPAAAGTGDMHNIYDILFATPQTANGTYTLLIGPNITDDSGNPMNQNGNGTNGEVGVAGTGQAGQDDRYLNSIAFTANTIPVITYTNPAVTPVVVTIPTQVSPPGSSINVPFFISDATDAATTLTLSLSSSNTVLVPNTFMTTTVVAGTNGQGRILHIIPANSSTGSTNITINVTDPSGLNAVAQTFLLVFDNPPVIVTKPGPQTIPHGQTLSLPITINKGTAAYTATVTASTVSAIYNLWSQYRFFASSSTYNQNALGLNEKQIVSQTTGQTFIIQPTGAFSILNANKTLTAVTMDQFGNALVLDNSYWQDPAKLTAPAAPVGITASLLGSGPNYTLNVTAPLNYVGPALVTISASDGVAPPANVSFTLTITNSPPAFNTPGTATVSGGLSVLNVQPSQSTVVLDMAAPAPGGYSLTDADDGIAALTLDGSAVYAATTATQVQNSLASIPSLSGQLAFTGAGNVVLSYNGVNAGAAVSNSSTAGQVQNVIDSISGLTDTLTFSAPGNAQLSYNGVNAAGNVSSASTAAQVLASLQTIPALVGKVSVTGGTGGPFAIYLYKGASASLLTVTSPGAITLPIAVTGATGGPFSIFFNSGALVSLLGVNSGPATYTVPVSVSGSNAGPYTVTFGAGLTGGTGATGLSVINGTGAATIALVNTTAALLQANLAAMPALSGSGAVTVTGKNGGPFTINFGSGIAGGNLLTLVSGSATVTTNSPAKTDTVTLTSTAPTGVLIFSYNGVSGTPLALNTDLITPTADGTMTFSYNGVASLPFSYASSTTAALAYELAQTYSLYFTGGTSTTNSIRSQATGIFYAVQPNGDFGSLDASNNFTKIATLDSSYYQNPNKLVLAPVPTALMINILVNDATDQIVIPSNGPEIVQLSAFDGQATTTHFFNVNVSTTPTPPSILPSFTLTPTSAASLAYNQVATASIANISAAPDPVTSVTFAANVYALPAGTTAAQFEQTLSTGVNLPPNLAQSGVGTFTTSFAGNNATGLTLTVDPHSQNQGNFVIQVIGTDVNDNGTLTKYFTESFFDQAPTFGVPANQTITHTTATMTLDLTKTASFANPSATPSPVLTYGLGSLSSVTLAVKAYYSNAAGTAYQSNPTANPEPPGADVVQAGFPTPAVTSYSVDNVNHKVTVNTNSSFVGTLIVKVTATSPTGLSTNQFFKLTVTAVAPTLTIKPTGNIPLSKTGTQTTVELVGNDPDSSNTKPLNYAVSFTNTAATQVNSLNLFIDKSTFFNYYGFKEIWLRSHTNGAWYAITPDGALHLLPTTTKAIGPIVAQLSPFYYTNYQLLLGGTLVLPAPAMTYTLVPANDPVNPDAMNLQLKWTDPTTPAAGSSLPILVTVTTTNSAGLSITVTFTVIVS